MSRRVHDMIAYLAPLSCGKCAIWMLCLPWRHVSSGAPHLRTVWCREQLAVGVLHSHLDSRVSTWVGSGCS